MLKCYRREKDTAVSSLWCNASEIVCNSGVFAEVDISAAHIAALSKKYGDYAFSARDPFKDWLDD